MVSERILPQAKSLSHDHKKPKYAHGLAVIIFTSPSLQCKSYWLCNGYIYILYTLSGKCLQSTQHTFRQCVIYIYSTNENKLKGNAMSPSIPP